MAATRLTRELGDFIAGLDARNTPPEARARAVGGFVDCIGVMTVGALEEPARTLRRVLSGQAGPAGIWPEGGRASATEAALINGGAAHALDYDDTGLKGHPSAVIVPAVLAVAEEVGATGADMITAYLAGYETWAELISREADQHPTKGWHITGIMGSVAAAAAAASLRRLDGPTAATALAIGASQSAGLLANFGTMTKPLHAGLSARAGVFAAELAAAGLTASQDALEHTQGFLAAVSPAGRIDVASPLKAGKEWRMLSVGLNVKKYPVCYCAHRPLDGALDLRKAHGVRVDDIDHVKVTMSARNATIMRYHDPQSGLEARFSMEFAMASAFIHGRLGLEQLEDGVVRSGDIRRFLPRVTMDTSVASDPVTGHGVYDKVDVTLRDGRVLSSGEVKAARGAASVPLSRDELFVKFSDCLRTSFPQIDAERLFETLLALEKAPGAKALYPNMQKTMA